MRHSLLVNTPSHARPSLPGVTQNEDAERPRAKSTMSLAGQGAVLIWHDIAPEGRDDFYAWHGVEHMPERLAIPGFLVGRRYVACDGGSPEFFNLYQTQTPAVLTGGEYLDRLNRPTPWTRKAVTYFRSVSRSLCQVALTFGRGEAGLVATCRYDVPPAHAAMHRADMATALAELATSAGIAGAHLLIADDAASAIATEEKKARGGGTDVPRWIVVVEGWGDESTLARTIAAFTAGPAFAHAAAAPVIGLYRLQLTVRTMPGAHSGDRPGVSSPPREAS